MRVQFAECVVLFQAVSAAGGIKQCAKPGDGAMSFEKVGTNAPLAAENLSAGHTGMADLI